MAEKEVGQNHGVHKTLEATKVLACVKCGAPGVWRRPKNTVEVIHYAKWPGCLVEAGDERDGQSVGDNCPNCGATRVGLLHNLGVIWRAFRPF